jgi:hypothetical protein
MMSKKLETEQQFRSTLVKQMGVLNEYGNLHMQRPAPMMNAPNPQKFLQKAEPSPETAGPSDDGLSSDDVITASADRAQVELKQVKSEIEKLTKKLHELQARKKDLMHIVTGRL